MSLGTDSHQDRYWRRRALVLAAVLGGVGLLAWACTGDSDGPVRDAGAVESTSPPPPPTAMPTVTVTVTATPSPRPARDGGPCDEEDLVFTMSSDASRFAGSERPSFRVTVVNTGRGSCRFDTASLDVRIMSGSDRIWSSAECRRDDPSTKTLRRGVPHVETVTWDRRRGCSGGSPARPGTYVAALKGTSAKKHIFHLR
ncbi:MAG TPA: hypothetical protein VIL71_21045 [Spirillospora sp.]